MTDLELKEKLLKQTQAIYDKDCNVFEFKERSTPAWDCMEFQRTLFEAKFFDPEYLNHVNWFAPSSCYYSKGCFNLGGSQSEESDIKGEIVDNCWQSWKWALYWNNRLGCNTSENLLFKSI